MEDNFKFIRLKNMPTYDKKTGIHRSIRCNLITFYCPRCNTIHIIERKDVVYIEFGNEKLMCCYESVKDWDKDGDVDEMSI